MAAPARDESLQDETYLPQENTAEIIDFLSALRDRGQEAAHPRPRLTAGRRASSFPSRCSRCSSKSRRP